MSGLGGYSVMIRKTLGRAKPVYPLRLYFASTGLPMWEGSTSKATCCSGLPARPCEFVRREDAESFAKFLRCTFSYKPERADWVVFVLPRGAAAKGAA